MMNDGILNVNGSNRPFLLTVGADRPRLNEANEDSVLIAQPNLFQRLFEQTNSGKFPEIK
jgi:hypothetical protein